MKTMRIIAANLALFVIGLTQSVYGLDKPGRIYADPIGSVAIDNTRVMDSLAMIINNAEDRVGARAKMCQTLSDVPCERLVFNFPQLRLDKSTNQILMGDKPVATLNRHGMRVTISKIYRLGYDISDKMTDSGFDKNEGKYLRVFLEPKSSESADK